MHEVRTSIRCVPVVAFLGVGVFGDRFSGEESSQSGDLCGAGGYGLENKEQKRLRLSVTDLATYLRKMSGARVSVFTREPQEGEGLIPILVGSLAEKAFGPPAAKSPYEQGWRMVASKGGVGLLGESSEAVSYAIYELLDRVGCRW